MLNLSTLLKKTPQIDPAEMLHTGYASWIVWGKALPGSIPQALSSFGGWEVTSDEGQSLWFFPDTAILQAWAQIYKWMRINPTILKVFLFPCKLVVGSDLQFSLSMDDECAALQGTPGSSFQVWAHPKLKEASTGIPGIGFEKPYSSSDAPGANWLVLNPEEQVSFTPSLSWFFVIDPLGKKSDEQFSSKWRKYKSVFEDLAQKLEVKYTSRDRYEHIFLLENIKQLSSWVQNLMDALQNEKDSWYRTPCLFAGVEKGDMVLQPSVLDRMSIDWGQLEPDFLYLPLQTIFQLGSAVAPLKTGSGLRGRKVTDLFQATTSTEDGHARKNLQIYLPNTLTSGKHHSCFYCGLKGHEPSQCPTRGMMSPQQDVWGKLEKMNLERISSGMEKMGEELAAGKKVGDLQSTGSEVGELARAILEINCACQLRTLRRVVNSKGRMWPEGLRVASEGEDPTLRSALENMRMGEHSFAAQKLRQATTRSSNDYQPRTLQGFLAMEGGQHKEAHNFWTEGESLSYTPLQRGYHVFLRARLLEVDEEPEKALQTYGQALKISPDMVEARYRQGVCLVKLGFPDQALGVFTAIMENNSEVFLKAIIDPELGRGHLHLLSGFYDLWEEAHKKAQQAGQTLEELKEKVEKWFDPQHPARQEFTERLKKIEELSGIDNYAAYNRLNQETTSIRSQIQKRIDQSIYELKRKQNRMLERLKTVEQEYAWFPLKNFFLRRTNRLFNDCGLRLNNFSDLNLQTPDGFKQGYTYIQEAEEILRELEQNLTVVSKFRDILLFAFFMFKRFLWVEALILVFSLLVVPAAVFIGMKSGQNWAISLFAQKWEVQKLGVLVVSIVAMGIAAVLTTLKFEREKKKYLSQF